MVKKIKSKKDNISEKSNKNTIENKRYSHILSTQKILKKELYSQKSETNDREEIEIKYSDYITKIFNSSIIHMLIVYIGKNKDKLKKYKYDKEQNFINNFSKLIKELYLNEIEVAYLTLLLDKIGLEFKNFEHWDYFYCLGIYSKTKVTSKDETFYFAKLAKNIEDQYYDLINESKFEDIVKKGITNKELNERFKELTKPINTYCRNNFINYSGIADKIVRLSQPYGIESNGNQLFNEKNINGNNDINNENNIDDNGINNLVPLTPYNQRTTISNDKHDLNLLADCSRLSLGKQKSDNFFSSLFS